MGGENRERTARLRRIGGSSPHGRGKPQVGDLSAARLRLIPAWAGKTTPTLARTLKCGAHPRMGGENARIASLRLRLAGSSPHGRGKPGSGAMVMVLSGLIPAWAGKTLCSCSWRVQSSAHPRMGGENVLGILTTRCMLGSSPHGRGKPAQALAAGGRQRLIPAWAGKTPPRTAGGPPCPAHPRMGGENGTQPPDPSGVGGSSPHGRGKRRPSSPTRSPARLIPAWAGKTPCSRVPSASWPAHPRMGGENAYACPVGFCLAGSSPHGRGKRCRRARRRRRGGLIPAWAGKTVPEMEIRDEYAAHPRMGGENHLRGLGDPLTGGSSPHGRGKPAQSPLKEGGGGLIPAWAGKTGAQ